MKEQDLSEKHKEVLRQIRIQDLAQTVLDVKARGLLDGWRDYLHDQQLQAGISNEEMRQAIANLG
ncbi:hypothetical protein ACFIQF_13155 [Comamonas sp. J-3]|uniref:hypothetical protein n=1 Tax=Comamonas trifloxystrobinivorans TaxID=3350256 RepID=UPI00372C7B44